MSGVCRELPASRAGSDIDLIFHRERFHREVSRRRAKRWHKANDKQPAISARGCRPLYSAGLQPLFLFSDNLKMDILLAGISV